MGRWRGVWKCLTLNTDFHHLSVYDPTCIWNAHEIFFSGEVGGLCEKGEGIKTNQTKTKQKSSPHKKQQQQQKILIDTILQWLLEGKGGSGRYKRVKGGRNGDGRKLHLGWWTYNTVYRWFIIDCTPETYVI